jgi:hypothetical protein
VKQIPSPVQEIDDKESKKSSWSKNANKKKYQDDYESPTDMYKASIPKVDPVNPVH